MRTHGFRPIGQTFDPDRKILFTPQQSSDNLNDRADRMEMLAALTDQPGNDGDALQLTAQLTRASTTYRGAPERLANEKASTQSHPSHVDLAKKYGKRSAKRIKAGRYAVEDDKIFNMSLWRAMYTTGRAEFWHSAALLFVACKSESRHEIKY